jgi:TRAP-type C4-dicarboxylate transport system, periplasmic component
MQAPYSILRRLSVQLSAALIGLSCTAMAPATASELQLRAAVFAPVDTTWGKPFKIFTDRINETGKGIISVRVVGPESIPGTEQPNAVRSGLIDMVATPPGMYKSAMPMANAQDLSNMTLAEQRASGGYDALNKILQRRLNATALTTYGTGVPFHLYFTKTDIRSEADLKGLRVRSQPLYGPFFDSLGLSQSMIPIPEVYTSLERGVVQGIGFAAWGLRDMGWDTLTKLRVDPGWYNVVINVVMNNKRLQGLTPEQRKVIDDAVVWFEEAMLAYTQKENEINLKQQQEAGIQSVDFGPQFAAKARDVYWKELERNNPDEIRSLRPLLEK